MRVGIVQLGIVAGLAAGLPGCGGAAVAAGVGTLRLADDGTVAGRLVPAASVPDGGRDTLLWQSPSFAEPFEFRLDAIQGIGFHGGGDRGEASGWRILFRDGDVLAADLEAIDGGTLTVRRGGDDGPRRLAIDIAEVDRVVRVGADSIGSYAGPGGLAGWKQAPPGSWAEEVGGIRSAVRGGSVERDVGGPARAAYDIVLSWRSQPGCRLAVAAADGGDPEPYQVEIFGGDAAPQLLLVREERDRAVSEAVPEAEGPAGEAAPRRLRIVVFVDQPRGRMAVVLPDRGPEPLAEVTIPPPPDRKPSGRFRLVGSGDIRLERLRVSPWRDERPGLERRETAIVVGRDGPRIAGEVLAWSAGDEGIVVRGETGDERLATADLREILFAEGPAAPAAEPAVRVTCHGGEVLGGDIVEVDKRVLRLRRAGIDEPVALPLDGLSALRSLTAADVAGPPPGRVGRLRLDGIDARGSLAAVAGGVGWQPTGSIAGSRFAVPPAAGAVLEYVEGSAGTPEDAVGGLGAQIEEDDDGFFVVTMMREDGAAAIDGRIRLGDRIVAIAPEEGSRSLDTKGIDLATVMNLLRGRIGTPLRLEVTAGDGTDRRKVELVRRSIHVASADILRMALADHARLAPGGTAAAAGVEFPALAFLKTGDVLPCAVESIDREGIRLRTPLGGGEGGAAVPHAAVQAVELVPAAASRAIDKARMERLLTVPRMQRANPPTHLLRLGDGDYLRGRLVAMDDRTVTLALGDAVKELPRDAVVRVIWLHPDALDEKPEPDAAAPEPVAGLLVQGVGADGRRVTLAAEGVDGTMIRGRNPVIGPAAIETDGIDRLLINAAIEAEARELPYRQWKLKPAPEPRALRDRAAPNAG